MPVVPRQVRWGLSLEGLLGDLLLEKEKLAQGEWRNKKETLLSSCLSRFTAGGPLRMMGGVSGCGAIYDSHSRTKTASTNRAPMTSFIPT